MPTVRNTEQVNTTNIYISLKNYWTINKLEMFSGAKKSFVPPPPVVGLQAVLS